MSNTIKISELEEQLDNIFQMIRDMKKELETFKKINAESEVGFEDDSIFLLSEEEYEKYKDNIPKINCWWWLRSPGISSHCAENIIDDGSVENYGDSVNYDFGAVRPVLRISNLERDTEIIYHCTRTHFVALGATWKIIDNEKSLAIAEMPIMFSQFDAESNDYEKSEIRKKLLDWYKERIKW